MSASGFSRIPQHSRVPVFLVLDVPTRCAYDTVALTGCRWRNLRQENDSRRDSPEERR